jgi:hypothetical protein
MGSSACASTYNCGEGLGAANAAGTNLAAIENTAGMISVVDGTVFGIRILPSQWPTEAQIHSTGTCGSQGDNYEAACARTRHLDTIPSLFVDGHAKAMQWKAILGDPTDPKVLQYWTTAANVLR